MKKQKEVKRVLKILKEQHAHYRTCALCGNEDDLAFAVDMNHTGAAAGAMIRLHACESCKNALEKVNVGKDAETLQEIVLEAAVNFLVPKVTAMKKKEEKRMNEIAAARKKMIEKQKKKEEEEKEGK